MPARLKLSSRQTWLLNQIRSGASQLQLARYNVVHAVRLTPLPDLDQFRDAYVRLMQAHEILRWTFTRDPDDDQPIARISDSMPTLTLCQVQSPDELQTRLVKDASANFNLEEGPLFEIILYYENASSGVFLMRAHHLVVDGASVIILMRNLLADLFGLGSAVKETKPYSAFVDWQEKFLESGEGQKLEDFWLAELSDLPPSLPLPSDRETASGAGIGIRKKLDGDTTDSVHALSQDLSITAFRTCLATYAWLIHLISGATDVPISLASAARSRSEFMTTIGWFNDTLILRAIIDPHEPFRDFAIRLDKQMDLILQYDGYPFHLLDEKLAHLFAGRKHCLDQVAFSMIAPDPRTGHAIGNMVASMAGTSVNIGEYQIESIPVSVRYLSPHQISFRLQDRSDAIYLSASFWSSMFSPRRAQCIVSYYVNLLGELAKNPHIAPKQLACDLRSH